MFPINLKLKNTTFWDFMLHNLVEWYRLGGIISNVSQTAGSFNPTSYSPDDGQLGRKM
jgi:hypothetical protein